MATKLFVGSLPWAVDDTQLEQLFADFGQVLSAKVIVDRDSNRSKGYGFVEFENDDEAKAAVEKLNGTEVQGRAIVVNEARPREERPRRDFGGNDRRY
ncbi:RNA-binding protein [Candidatus Saccharibacteria bacterium]|jgi:RNA recognition motif-containing protein|nr:RNA-binding protein [Candidatus Saccharibacteria bacterium]HPR08974.1 RNA-binding protein [Candidatus Saccharibacteria bacterium]